jgi:hypothetical protein
VWGLLIGSGALAVSGNLYDVSPLLRTPPTILSSTCCYHLSCIMTQVLSSNEQEMPADGMSARPIPAKFLGTAVIQVDPWQVLLTL